LHPKWKRYGVGTREEPRVIFSKFWIKLSFILFLCCSFTSNAQKTFVALHFVCPMMEKWLNLANELGKYWNVFDDKYMFGDGLWPWGIELCNFTICCCQTHFWHFHIVVFSLCKIDLGVHLFVALDFWLHCCCLKMLVLIVAFLNVFIIYEVLELLIPLHNCFWLLCLRYIKLFLCLHQAWNIKAFGMLFIWFWLLVFDFQLLAPLLLVES
jgi:hypothetical protein